jgi:hypothetical protein
MKRSGITGERLVATFMLGGVLLNYPVLYLFARPTTLGGIPLIYVYVFGVWTLLIAVMALVVERSRG